MKRLLTSAVAASALIALAAAPSAAGDFDLPVAEKTLPNGMKVLVLEDHAIPNCALYVWWRVGSRNEKLGATGIAHFFEHMMFRGGAKYGKTFDVAMEGAGGSNNAFTERDVTVYQDWFPKEALPLILDIEKDRMSGMVFDKDAVANERNVVASEWRSDYENPAELVDEQLWATAYKEHPYHWSVLGWWNDVENWKQTDLEDFYARNYAPNNATVVLVGDVNAADAMKAIESSLGSVPRRPDREPLHSREGEQHGERRAVLESTIAPAPQVRAAWHICATDDPDFPALEVLEALLLHGESSILQQLLVEKEQVCQEVTGGWQGHQFDPSLFTVDMVLVEGGDPTRAEALVYGALEKLAKDGPDERAMRKAKNGLKADFVRRMRTRNDMAFLVGETETFFGGWRNLGARVAKIEAVTPADVKAALAKYFSHTNRTVVTLVPVPKTKPARAEGERKDEDDEKDEMDEKDEKEGGK
jgi:zinc protease